MSDVQLKNNERVELDLIDIDQSNDGINAYICNIRKYLRAIS